MKLKSGDRYGANNTESREEEGENLVEDSGGA